MKTFLLLNHIHVCLKNMNMKKKLFPISFLPIATVFSGLNGNIKK